MRIIIRIARLFNTLLPLSLTGLMFVFGCWMLFGESLKAIVKPEKILGFRVDGSPKEVFELRPARFSSASDVVILKYVKRKENLGYGEDWSGDIRNLLFIGPGDGGAKWLFPDENLLLVDVREWPDKNKPITALSIVTRHLDDIPEYPSVNLYFVKPDGSGLTRVLTEVREVLEQKHHDGVVRIIYKNDLKIYSLRFSLRDWEIKDKRIMVDLIEDKN